MDYKISCDKLIIVGKLNGIEYFINTALNPYKYQYFECSKECNQLYRYKYCVNAPNIYFFFGLNHPDKDKRGQIKIVYNPNKRLKTTDKNTGKVLYDSDRVLEFLLSFCKSYELRECDIACDFLNIDRKKCLFVPNPRSFYSYLKSNGITEYSGKHHTHGYTKLYDKQVESELDYKCVRLEHTFTRVAPFEFIPHFNYIDSEADDNLIQLLCSSDSVAFNKFISGLSYPTRQKYLKIIHNGFYDSTEVFNEMYNVFVDMYRKYTFMIFPQEMWYLDNGEQNDIFID